MNNKRRFSRISLFYITAVAGLSIIFFLFHNKLSYKGVNFLLLYFISTILLNILYYFLLQRTVRIVKYPDITILSAFCTTGGFALGIIFPLLTGITKIQPIMLLVFAPIYMMLPVWVGYRIWISKAE